MSVVLTRHHLLFAAIALVLVALSHLLLSSEAYKLVPASLAMGLSIDLTVTMTAAFYFLVVRPNHLKEFLIVPFFIASVLLAGLIIPSEHHQTLNVFKWMIALIELPLIGYLIWKIYRVSQTMDTAQPVESLIQDFFENLLPSKLMAHIATTEVAYMYYAFCGWTKATPLVDNVRSFSHHKNGQWQFFVMGIIPIIVAESFAIHYYVVERYPVLAYIHLLLAVYSIFWLIGDWQAIRHSKHEFSDQHLVVNVGLRAKTKIALKNIESYTLGAPQPEQTEVKRGEFFSDHVPGYAQLTDFGEAELTLQLREPVTIQWLFGVTSTADKIGVNVDELRDFERQLKRYSLPFP